MLKNLISVVLLLTTSITGAHAEADPWKDLFDGVSLDGWVQRNGEANYEVVDGSIVGTTVPDTPNSFLCTTAHYSDFILEVDFKVNPKMNSGIQIRSNSFPEYRNGRVHGYQIEIDPSERAWSAGVYDEGRRGWLNSLEANPGGQKAFRQNEWNHYRIEAIGDTIRTWINGVPAAHLVDTMTDNGFIALQVHGVHDKEKEGITIQWRNIRIIDESVLAYARSTPLPPYDNFNRLTSKEQEGGWKLIWDGETSDGWRGTESDGFPESGWVMENDRLTVLASTGAESRAGGDIMTVEKYRDFEFWVDFKVTAGANSGIKYFVDTELNKGEGSGIGLEYQILDDERHPDAKRGNHQGSRTAASLYDLIEATNKYPRPVGEWNNAKIVSSGNHVEHWLNGRKVLEFERKSPEFRELVAESKYAKWDGFGELPEGPILLQDHGDRVSFRNIKIKVLE